MTVSRLDGTIGRLFMMSIARYSFNLSSALGRRVAEEQLADFNSLFESKSV